MVQQGLWRLSPQHSLWAHRPKTHLSTSFLSWLKHQLPLEAPSLAQPTKIAPQSASAAACGLPKLCFICCMLSPLWLTSATRVGTCCQSPLCPQRQHLPSVLQCSRDPWGEAREALSCTSAHFHSPGCGWYRGTFQFAVYVH